MDYKYKKGQIFGKRLKVPKYILRDIYACRLSLKNYFEFELEDKIPLSCVGEPERKIAEKFGIEKCRNLNWKFISSLNYNNINAIELIMQIDSDSKDLNRSLYEMVKNMICPNDYCDEMKEIYSERLVEVPRLEDEDFARKNYLFSFNRGELSLVQMIYHWKTFKEKDLSYCLIHDRDNSESITDETLKKFMSKYDWLLYILMRNKMIDNKEIYRIIDEFSSVKTEEEEKEFETKYANYILNFVAGAAGAAENDENNNSNVRITNDEYKKLFKYVSLGEYLSRFNYDNVPEDLIKELEALPEDYIFDSPIPFQAFLDYHVLRFINEYGIKNVVDFDNECGNFFTNNNCEMLKLMFNMYMHYAGNEHNPNRSIYTRKYYDEDGNYVKAPYTKDEFYEAMRRMIVFGPSDWNYVDKAPDYRTMTGEFRNRNSELFISEEAPEELQKLFYTKSITPKALAEHPEYIQYLTGKDLSSCFKAKEIRIDNNYDYINLYEYLIQISDYDEAINFVVEYCDFLDIAFDRNIINYNTSLETVFYKSDDINKVKSRINKSTARIIIEKSVKYPERIPKSFKEEYPSLFLSEDAPSELKEAFYNREINSEYILSHPECIKYLKEVDLEVVFKYMPVKIKKDEYYSWYRNNKNNEVDINISKAARMIFGEEEAFDVMLIYGKYIERAYEGNKLSSFTFDHGFSKDDFLDELDNSILKAITDGKMKYDENMPTHFKNNNPSLFLDEKLPDEIRKKFYNREFSLEDFENDSELMDKFGNTNIACGFPEHLSWVMLLFSVEENLKVANHNRLKVISAYSKINDIKLKEKFIEYLKKYGDNLNIEKVDCISEVLTRLEYSNAIELYSFRETLVTQLLNTDDPLTNLEKIEDVFLKNNLPLCGKMFLCFKILYPNLSDVSHFSFNENSRVAPELKDESLPKIGLHSSNDEKRLMIIFNDLLRISCKSGEKSLLDYLNDIEIGNKLYVLLQENNFNLNELSEEEIEKLEIFVSHLEILYQNTKHNNSDEINFDDLSLIDKLKILSDKFKETKRYELKDRIVRSFCHTAGIDSFDELKKIILNSQKEQGERANKFLEELEKSDGVFRFREGDFVRGIGYLDSLSGSLGTGNFSKEHLGVFLGTSKSDTTPLDVDLTMVTNPDSIYDAIEGTPTGFGFGNIYVIMRKDNPNLNITRDKDGNLTGAEYDPRKVEVFGTHIGASGYETHWGARTGISLADVDCILFKERRTINPDEPYDENGNVNYIDDDTSSHDELQTIKFEIARNGYYIPVIDFSGRLIFTKEEFKALREKTQGLSYYGENSYVLSDELVTPEVEEIAGTLTEDATNDTISKRGRINEIIKEALEELGIGIYYSLNSDLSDKSADFIDTGSTGRYTNVPYDGDFDFFMRLDAEIMRNPSLLDKLKDKIKEKFSKYHMEDCKTTDKGDLRFKKVKIDDDTVVDIDISFGVKTNKVRYSSDECLRDRLETIKRLYPDQYKYVVSNIILAKKILKDPDVNAYKPRRTDAEQGGIGGIGVENWILQNGGSFVQACRSFLAVAFDKNGCLIPFKEFKKKYQIWDFGENHFSARDGKYIHDNFIENNMNETGYKKMAKACQEYLNSLKHINVDEDNKKL